MNLKERIGSWGIGELLAILVMIVTVVLMVNNGFTLPMACIFALALARIT